MKRNKVKFCYYGVQIAKRAQGDDTRFQQVAKFGSWTIEEKDW